ncbi:hypothetical protein BT69DRAFT_1277951, partial [Atractiella rhizophila]
LPYCRSVVLSAYAYISISPPISFVGLLTLGNSKQTHCTRTSISAQFSSDQFRPFNRTSSL